MPEISPEDRRRLLEIIQLLISNPAAVDQGLLATARNLAARAGYERTRVALDQVIEKRGNGAQDPDALRAAEKILNAPSPPSSAAPSVGADPPAETGRSALPYVLGVAIAAGLWTVISERW